MKSTVIAQDKPHPLTNKYIVAMAAITCALLWGSAFPVLKISYTEMKLAPDDLNAKVIFFFYNGLAHVTGMKGAILNSSGTFFVYIMAHFAYSDDRLNWRKSVGLAAGLLGVMLVNYGEEFTLDFSWQGEGFLIMAGLATAIATIISKNISGKIHPLILTAWQMMLGSVLLLLIGFHGLTPQSITFTPKAWVLF